MKKPFVYNTFMLAIFTIIFISCGQKSESQESEKNEKNTKENFWAGDTTSKIEGIDVSHHQDTINWKKVRASGISFVFVKATQGVTYLDPMFNKNWEETKNEDLIRGAYHFYMADDDPIEQAEWFIKNIGGFENVIPPVVDVERAPNTIKSKDDFVKDLFICLNNLEKLSGKKPIIYSSPSFADKYLDHTRFGSYKLWLADYNNDPTIPIPWEKSGWEFWQYTPQDTIPGIPKRVDRSIYSADYAKLLELVNQ